MLSLPKVIRALQINLYIIYWVVGRKSQFRLENKLLALKTSLKTILTYGTQLWASASTSDSMMKTERSTTQSSTDVVDTLWYVPNEMIRRHLKVNAVEEYFSVAYRHRLNDHKKTNGTFTHKKQPCSSQA